MHESIGPKPVVKAISACLLGLPCRYDGQVLPRESRYEPREGERLLPVCPEQLGGLPTPRPPAVLVGGAGGAVLEGGARVVARDGRDVTEAFLRGAECTLALCRILGADRAILKSRSPSCGVGRSSGAEGAIPGDGVTAALLRREGIEVQEHPG